MLDEFKPHRASPWYASLFFPLPPFDMVKMLAPALILGSVSAFLMEDLYLFVLVAALGYVCILIIGQSFIQHELILCNEEDLYHVVHLLDTTVALKRESIGELKWSRKNGNVFFNSAADNIIILPSEGAWRVRGRKYDIVSLAIALNARLR